MAASFQLGKMSKLITVTRKEKKYYPAYTAGNQSEIPTTACRDICQFKSRGSSVFVGKCLQPRKVDAVDLLKKTKQKVKQ